MNNIDSKVILLKDLILIPVIGEQSSLRGDLLIRGDRIAAVGVVGEAEIEECCIEAGISASEMLVIDCEGRRIAMPGLVNGHAHMAMGLFRNFADDLPLMEWLREKIWPAEAKLTPEDIYWGTLLGMAELIRSGCTSFRDMYFAIDRVADATELSGLRGVLGLGIVGFGDENFSKLEQAIALHRAHHGRANGQVSIEIAPHAPYTCNDVYLKRAYQAAVELDTTFHIHLSESVVEVQESYKEFGISPVQKLANLGVLSARTSAAHCVQLDENDLDLLAQHQVHVLYNPSSNLKLGNGFARIGEMIRRGINVAIGTDGSSSNNNVNMLEELHLAAMVNKGVDRDPTVLPAAEAIRMATLGGAKALGLTDVGGLAVGYKADLILIDIEKPHLTPLGDPLSAVVYSVAGSDVTDMLVDGRFLMRDSRILTFDEKEVMQKIREIAPRLLGTTE